MSQFTINKTRYDSDEGLDKAIHRLFELHTKFDYQYDFGSTTKLKGQVISHRPGKLSNDICLLAQNNLPEEIQCYICQKPPGVICSNCDEIFCSRCKRDHDGCGGEEYFLPVVNSPRMGICGYTGPS